MKQSLWYRLTAVTVLIATSLLAGWLCFRLANSGDTTVDTGPWSQLWHEADHSYMNKNYSQSLVHYREMARRDPYDGVAHYRLAVSLLEVVSELVGGENPDEASPDPAEPAPGESSEIAALLDEATVAISAAIEHRQWRTPSKYQLARIYYIQGNMESASNVLNEIRDTEPGFVFRNILEYFPKLLEQGEFRDTARMRMGEVSAQ